MNEQLELKRVEYRVRPVTRYIVTRFEAWNLPEGSKSAQSDDTKVVECGEFASPDQAWQTGYALAKQYHELAGWPVGDERIQYPSHPTEGGQVKVLHGDDCTSRHGGPCNCRLAAA